MIFDRLNHLSNDVLKTFQPEFVFLVLPDKVQHFPARNWAVTQFREALAQHLGSDYTLTLWNSMILAISANKEAAAILPRFHDLAEFNEKA